MKAKCKFVYACIILNLYNIWIGSSFCPKGIHFILIFLKCYDERDRILVSLEHLRRQRLFYSNLRNENCILHHCVDLKQWRWSALSSVSFVASSNYLPHWTEKYLSAVSYYPERWKNPLYPQTRKSDWPILLQADFSTLANR